MVELVTVEAKTRGKSTRTVQYKGIGKYVGEGNDARLVTEGQVTDIKDALSLCDNDMQKVLDNFAIGFNLEAYRAVSDALAEFIEPSWNDNQVKMFRASVNALKALNMPIEKAVEFAKASPALQAAITA